MNDQARLEAIERRLDAIERHPALSVPPLGRHPDPRNPKVGDEWECWNDSVAEALPVGTRVEYTCEGAMYPCTVVEPDKYERRLLQTADAGNFKTGRRWFGDGGDIRVVALTGEGREGAPR